MITEQETVSEGQKAVTAPPETKGDDMKARTITAIAYVAVIIGLLVLKWLVPYGEIGYDLLFWAISVIGAYEFMRAVGGISKAQWWTTMITCVLIIPSFVISKMLAEAVGYKDPATFALMFLMGVSSLGTMITVSITVFDIDRSNLRSTAYSAFCILYCGVLGSVGSNINHLAINSLPAVMLLFFLTAGVDTFALLFGKMFGKILPMKLAPHTSPKKTVIGAIGGIVGGVTAAVVAWACCEYIPGIGFEYDGKLPDVVVFILISLPSSVLAQLGDLFESAIKRGCGIKDMGKCLPGHGGILDRFDSMLFASVSIIVCFVILR